MVNYTTMMQPIQHAYHKKLMKIIYHQWMKIIQCGKKYFK